MKQAAPAFQWEDYEDRDLYEESQSKTIFFTTSSSTKLNVNNIGRSSAFTGLYRCTLASENNFDDFEGEDHHVCHEASKVADGSNLKGSDDHHAKLLLRNLQFDLSSLRSSSSSNNNNNNNNNSSSNYIYANTSKEKDVKSDDGNYWELIRAPLPDEGDFESDVINPDGSLRFEVVFKTRAVIDWNECDFECCPQQRLPTVVPYEYQHAYVRTYVRAFVVDEHTGDVFVSWEGFYQDCTDAYAKGKKLAWTIGISRLKTEDPTCAMLEDPAKANDQWLEYDVFPRCTEPVSIVFQSTRGREVVLPYGGLALVPASNTGTDRRTFLLSILHSPGVDSGECVSRVWAFPEGAHSIEDGLKRQDLTGTGTLVDSIFFDGSVWDGGSIRLNHNPQKGRPDHFCRTIFNRGIECYPINIATDETNGLPVVTSTGKPEIFLSKEQTEIFCRLPIANKTHRRDYGRKTTIVTGLDVQWDATTREPHRVFFGCYGAEGGNGNFGSVQVDGNNLKRVMEHAFAEAVLFLPRELEGTLDRDDYIVPTSGTAPQQQSSSSSSLSSIFGSVSTVFLLVALASVAVYKVYKKARKLGHTTLLRNETGFGTPYVELPNMGPSFSSDEEEISIL